MTNKIIIMIWYIYWYFTFYSIYQRFSSDKHFDIFAVSMFSVFVLSLTIGCIGFILYLFDCQGILLDNVYRLMAIGIIPLVINQSIFLPSKRRKRFFQIYRNNQSPGRDIFTIFLSILSIAIIILYGFFAHDYLNSIN